MDREYTINNINKKYRNSIGVTQAPVAGGYGSSYRPPVIIENTGNKIGGSIVKQGFESVYAGKTSVPAGFPQQHKVIKTRQVTNINHNQTRIPINKVIHNQTNNIQNQVNDPSFISDRIKTSINHQLQAKAQRNHYQNTRSNQVCPWWCWLICGLLTLLLLIGFCGGLWTYLKNSKSQHKNIQTNISSQKLSITPITQTTNNQTKQLEISQEVLDNKTQQAKDESKEETKIQQNQVATSNSSKNQELKTNEKVIKLSCQNGYYYFNGRCLTCPSQAIWNGTNCIKRKQITVVVSSQSQKTQTADSDNERQSQNSGSNTTQNLQQTNNIQKSQLKQKQKQKQQSQAHQQQNSNSNSTSTHHLRSFVY